MFELEHTEQVKRLIEITKSNSGISGPELAKAHIELGRMLLMHLEKMFRLNSKTKYKVSIKAI